FLAQLAVIVGVRGAPRRVAPHNVSHDWASRCVQHCATLGTLNCFEHKRVRPPRGLTMQRIVVLNPKGGSGKTTIAINLASYYAISGEQPALLDFDPQASAARWARKRQVTQAPIHLITAFEKDSRVTRAF